MMFGRLAVAAEQLKNRQDAQIRVLGAIARNLFFLIRHEKALMVRRENGKRGGIVSSLLLGDGRLMSLSRTDRLLFEEPWRGCLRIALSMFLGQGGFVFVLESQKTLF